MTPTDRGTSEDAAIADGESEVSPCPEVAPSWMDPLIANQPCTLWQGHAGPHLAPPEGDDVDEWADAR